MALATRQDLELGQRAPDFDLEATDGRRYRLADMSGTKATLVMFICNHCPYVRAVLHDIIRDVRELSGEGVKAIAVMSNDNVAYPANSFEAMRNLADAEAFPFLYAIDRTQDVARAYGAVCTPDFFGFNAARELQYHGRIYALQEICVPFLAGAASCMRRSARSRVPARVPPTSTPAWAVRSSGAGEASLAHRASR